MREEMISEQIDAYLERIAELIEANAKSAEDAAKIVRDSKIKAK